MGNVDYPGRGEFDDLMRRVRALETQSPLEHSSITGGRVRFIGGLLQVDSGGSVVIVGTLQVDGVSTVTGQFNVDGPFNLAGDGTITGQLTISGPVDITGDVDLTGVMTVTGDIEVTGSGRIKVGNIIIEDGKIKAGGMTINPDVNGGQVEFGGGRSINAGSNFLGVYDGDRFVVFNSSGVAVVAGGKSIRVGSDGITLSGLPTIAKSATADNNPRGSIYADSGGALFRVVEG